MPYIIPERRIALDSIECVHPETDGELNYCITKLLQDYINTFGVSYTSINSCMGTLSCAGKEFYRRVASQYEDTKIKDNGDVY